MITKNGLNPVLSALGNLNETSKSGKGASSSQPMDFGKVMDKTTETKNPSQKNTESADTKGKEEISQASKPQEKETPSKTQDVDNGKVKAEQPKPADQPEAAKDISDEELVTAMEAMNSQIMQTVMDTLGISQEQLTKALGALDMEPADLLEPGNVTKLVMELNGTQDISDMLTNEDLTGQLKALTDALEQMGQEEGMTKEEMSQLLTQLEEAGGPDFQKNQVQDKAQDIPEETAPKEKEITVTVEKQPEENRPVKEEMTGKDHQSRRDSKPDSQHGMADTFVENLAVKGNVQTDLNGVMERIETMREIVNQVVEQIKVTVKPDMSSMEIQLNPENLGKVHLAVAAKDGVLTATFTAQNDVAKEALESQVQVLRDNLSNQGLKVEAIEVTVSSFEFNFNQNNQMDQEQGQKKDNSSRRINLDDFDEKSEAVTEEEVLAARVMEQNGGSVDYTA